MNDRHEYRIPMFTDKGHFVEYQYVTLGDIIEVMLCGYNGEPEQCTGLHDKNGKLIYEGDCVVLVNGATHPITVLWDGIGWKFIRNGKRIEYAYESDIMSDISKCEIIGNIHETEVEK